MTELGNRILADHREREELLLLHQEALIEQDLALALARYEEFLLLLRAHVGMENRDVLPLHAQVQQPRWRTQVYALEHDKILELAEMLHERLRKATTDPAVMFCGEETRPHAGNAAAAALDDVVADPGPARRRWIIRLLDDERTLKNVLEHHEEREEKGLLPELGLAKYPL